MKIRGCTVYQEEEDGTGDRQTDSTAVTKDGRSQQHVRDRLELWPRCSKTLIPAVLSYSGSIPGTEEQDLMLLGLHQHSLSLGDFPPHAPSST